MHTQCANLRDLADGRPFSLQIVAIPTPAGREYKIGTTLRLAVEFCKKLAGRCREWHAMLGFLFCSCPGLCPDPQGKIEIRPSCSAGLSAPRASEQQKPNNIRSLRIGKFSQSSRQTLEFGTRQRARSDHGRFQIAVAQRNRQRRAD